MVLLASHSVPEEGIQHTESNVTVNIEDNDVGTGTLYITESCVLWLNPNDEGIQLEYRQINLHAISRDLQAFPREHLLCHYEGKLPGLNRSDNDSADEDNEDDAASNCALVEIRFIPENKESLEAMFEALADCQTLHPDSDCQLSEDEFENADEEAGGDGIYNTEADASHLTEEGRATMERLNNLILGGQGDGDILSRTNQITLINGHTEPQADEEQFQDADGMDE